MKKLLFACYIILTSMVCFSQNISKNYDTLRKKADALYRAGSYSKCAALYAEILQLEFAKLDIWDWDRAAFSYALAGDADSAFYYLDVIARLDSISFSDYIDVIDDRDFASVRKDIRWKAFKLKAIGVANNTFANLLKTKDDKAILEERKLAAIAQLLNEQYDSTFYHLDLLADSKGITFSVANDAVKDRHFRSIRDDKRWSDFTTKIYMNVLKSLSLKLNGMGDKGSIQERKEAAIAWKYCNQPDSVFYQLSKIADSKDLSFEDVFFIVTDGEFSNVSSENNFKLLEKDSRWPLLKEKLFLKLYKKYFPEKAFVNTKKAPKQMLIDGGHFNLHDIEGTYAPLAGSLRYAGIDAVGYKGKFNAESLKNVELLLIANPNPDRQDSVARRAQRAKEPLRWSTAATQPGYSNDEVTAIHNWVENGGSLLLILDHAPNGKVGEAIAAAFGIENRNVGTYDPLSRDPAVDTTEATTLLFTRSKGLIGKHPIVNGIDSITTYTGESLVGPPGSDVLLHLPATARDQDWLPETRQFRWRSAAGRTQGVAFDYGKGRVVMLGEAAITRPKSLSQTNRGNWKFILNILRWLAREKMD
jgi:hypothetical protein